MIQFEDRAVAFIDVLGFKALVNKAALSASDLSKLNLLVELLGAVIPFLDGNVEKSIPQLLIPRHICISDCIILSAPLQVSFDEYKNYSGLEILVMRVIQVTQYSSTSVILSAGPSKSERFGMSIRISLDPPTKKLIVLNLPQKCPV